MSFDTSFLIDLQRERRSRRQERPAQAFLVANPQVEPAISTIALGEFAEGFPTVHDPLVTWVRQTHVVLPCDDEVALAYAEVTRALRAQGQLIGSNDLWIAATALRFGLPVVTSNRDHFARVPGLEVIAHR